MGFELTHLACFSDDDDYDTRDLASSSQFGAAGDPVLPAGVQAAVSFPQITAALDNSFVQQYLVSQTSRHPTFADCCERRAGMRRCTPLLGSFGKCAGGCGYRQLRQMVFPLTILFSSWRSSPNGETNTWTELASPAILKRIGISWRQSQRVSDLWLCARVTGLMRVWA